MVWKENRENAYCEITPAILALKEQWEKKNYIDPKLYKEYNVKRGLRDEDGRGVLTGLTRVGEIQSYSVTEGEHIIPQDGILYYRGIDARELVKGKVLDNNIDYDAKTAAEELAKATRSEVVQVIGTKFVLYRESHSKPREKRIQLVKTKKKSEK